MNILLRELNANKKSLIIWSICMILFVAMGMQKYEAFVAGSTGGADINKIMDSMPTMLKTMWGLSSFDLTTPIGYFGILFPFIVLMGGIHAGMLGANIISKEERDKTVEFIMTKPVSRNKILTAKIMACLINILVLNIVTYVTAMILLSGLTTDSISTQIILSAVATFFVQLLFMAIGVGISTMTKNYKKSASVTTSILLGTYFLSLIIDMTGKLEMLNFLTPFKYFDAKDFLITNKLNSGYTLLTISIITFILVMSYRRYNSRDLNT